MRTHVGALLAFAALASIPAAALQLQTDSMTVEGSVVSAGSTSLAITTSDGTTKTFVVDADTTLPAAELAAGTAVAVRYRSLDADRAQALTVSLLDPAAGTQPASTTESQPGSEAPPAGPEGAPFSLLGVASLALVVAFVFVWVFGRRRHQEVPHLSL